MIYMLRQTQQPEFVCVYHPMLGTDSKTVESVARLIEERMRKVFGKGNIFSFYTEAADREEPVLVSPLGIVRGEYRINEFLSAVEDFYKN